MTGNGERDDAPPRGEPRGTAALDLAMDRYARGEDAAFAELYDGLAPRLYGYLVRRTGDAARAEDLVQQTMLQIHRARGRFQPGAAVLPWAFAIARRLLIDGVRRKKNETSLDDDEALTATLAALDTPADELAMAKNLAERLQKELDRLPEAQRVAFELVKEQELSVADAAAVLGTTVSAVKLRAHRAYVALREALRDVAPKSSGTREDES